MFDFIFGGKRKLALINKLYDQRLRNDDIAYGLNKKKLSKVQLLSTPEGTIITIIQTVMSLQKSGVLLNQIFQSIESHRKSTGHDPLYFNKILQLSMGENSGESVAAYCNYRISIEYPEMITDEQVENVILEAIPEIQGW